MVGYSRRRDWGFGALIGLAIVALLVLSFGYVVAVKNSQTHVTATVTDKERVCSGASSGSSDCQYLIFTDKGTFKDTDSMLYGKFNSSDVYGSIKRGQTYDFTVVGWRIPFFSMYKNIIHVN